MVIMMRRRPPPYHCSPHLNSTTITIIMTLRHFTNKSLRALVVDLKSQIPLPFSFAPLNRIGAEAP